MEAAVVNINKTKNTCEKLPGVHNITNSNVGSKLSVISVVCRICYDNDKDEILIAPCKCKGTVAFVHRSCLETWLAESNSNKCELCHETIQIERTPKYTTIESLWRWCMDSPRIMGHAVRGDIVACTLITPLAIVITYVCLFSSEYYNQRKFAGVPAARWTSLSLLVMIGIMLIGYYLWVYSVIRMNARLWYNWWQRACIVRYIPPSTVNLSYSEQLTVPPNNTPNRNGVLNSDTESEDEQNVAIRREFNKNDVRIVINKEEDDEVD